MSGEADDLGGELTQRALGERSRHTVGPHLVHVELDQPVGHVRVAPVDGEAPAGEGAEAELPSEPQARLHVRLVDEACPLSERHSTPRCLPAHAQPTKKMTNTSTNSVAISISSITLLLSCCPPYHSMADRCQKITAIRRSGRSPRDSPRRASDRR